MGRLQVPSQGGLVLAYGQPPMAPSPIPTRVRPGLWPTHRADVGATWSVRERGRNFPEQCSHWRKKEVSRARTGPGLSTPKSPEMLPLLDVTEHVLTFFFFK